MAQKQMPLNVARVEQPAALPADRDVEDHVFCVFEFPPRATTPTIRWPSKKESACNTPRSTATASAATAKPCFGTEGTLLLETEKEAMLYKTNETAKKIKVAMRKRRPE